eukprot:2842165-Ditylum_brightwellii.AAC.1
MERLGEDICNLLLCKNGQNHQLSFINKLSEVVIFQSYVLGSWAELESLCNSYAGLIVLKHLIMNIRLRQVQAKNLE